MVTYSSKTIQLYSIPKNQATIRKPHAMTHKTHATPQFPKTKTTPAKIPQHLLIFFSTTENLLPNISNYYFSLTYIHPTYEINKSFHFFF